MIDHSEELREQQWEIERFITRLKKREKNMRVCRRDH